jgi:hypothetical protein
MDEVAAKPKRSGTRQGIAKGARRRITMIDFARKASCSQATVSFVLNRTEGVKIGPPDPRPCHRRSADARLCQPRGPAPDYLYELDIPIVLLNCYTADLAFRR